MLQPAQHTVKNLLGTRHSDNRGRQRGKCCRSASHEICLQTEHMCADQQRTRLHDPFKSDCNGTATACKDNGKKQQRNGDWVDRAARHGAPIPDVGGGSEVKHRAAQSLRELCHFQRKGFVYRILGQNANNLATMFGERQ